MSEINLLPLVTEKSLAMATERKVYTFLVPIGANKIEIGKAVKRSFKVNPTKINTVLQKGKSTQTLVKRGSRRVKGRQSNVKKAFITLTKGESIALFEEKSK